jgi:hypothetical protein
MILSHKHKFIFLKTKKTASTSVEIALSAICGPEDVITPISPEDEALRASLGYRGAQNYRPPLPVAARHYLRRGRWPRFYNHMSAFEVKRLVGERIWQEYFTFCFERNPWERALSQYYFWRHRKERNTDFHSYIRSGKLDPLERKTSALYRQGEEILVDRVCRYEDFEEELRGISIRLGLTEPLRAPNAKGGIRSRQAEHCWQQQDVDYIAELFKFEIESFGYQPPSRISSRPPLPRSP